MSPLSTVTSPQEIYEFEVSKARDAFIERPALLELLDPDADPIFIELFLIYYNALGVSMTEPVESWICRAGERCKQIGFIDLGASLCVHATHEAGHHEMMINDTQHLVEQWNKKHSFQLDAQEILAQPITPGVQNYIKLHEDVIASDAPFGQLAIELEIERLSVTVVPDLLKQFVRVLGSDILQGLSFLEEHVALDVSHTHFNNKQINKFLEQNPDAVMSLVNAGQKALEAYGTFLEDCVRLAKAKMNTL